MGPTEEARLREQSDKFKWQVRDTCRRAEVAEAALNEAVGLLQRYRDIRDVNFQLLASDTDTFLAQRTRRRWAGSA